VRTFWIDKTLGLDLQTTISGKANGVEMRTKSIESSLKFNEHFADTLFTFKPPADAVEVDEVIRGMKALLAATPADGPEPAAFVPNLVPIHRAREW
jgi:hypothetical protein